MIRSFGWKPEVNAPTDAGWRLSAGMFRDSRIPLNTTLLKGLDLEGAILDQGPSSSCVAQAISWAIRLLLAMQSPPTSRRISELPLPSRRWIYKLSRETHRDADVDDGTFISSGIYVPKVLGWVDEKRVPWDVARINDAMDASDRRHAFDQKGTVQEYSITSWGDARITQVKTALLSGYPIVFGAHVDQAFLDCNTWSKQELLGDLIGGHAMVLVGYDSDGVHLVNSWGIDWGMGGLGLLSWAAVAKRIRDLRVITLAKEPTS